MTMIYTHTYIVQMTIKYMSLSLLKYRHIFFSERDVEVRRQITHASFFLYFCKGIYFAPMYVRTCGKVYNKYVFS